MQYIEEHITCRYYAVDGPIIQIRTFEKGEYLTHESVQRSVLCFLLEGSMRISPVSEHRPEASAGTTFFIARGETFWGEARETTTLILCFLDGSIALCNAYTLKNLIDSLPGKAADPGIGPRAVLPIHPHLRAELDVTRATLITGLFCIHYQREKRDIILLLLRGFYTKEELARLFGPALSMNYAFKQTILGIYHPAINVQEMIDRSEMPPTSFNRKFAETFGTSPSKWLLRKKKENILCDLLMTELSVKEIAKKHGLTPNYFNTFCQQHLGNSPLEIRKNGPASRAEI